MSSSKKPQRDSSTDGRRVVSDATQGSNSEPSSQRHFGENSSLQPKQQGNTLERNPHNINNTQDWRSKLSTMTRSSFIHVMAIRINLSMRYNEGQSVSFARELEARMFTKANSCEEYFQMYYDEIDEVKRWHQRSQLHSAFMPPLPFVTPSPFTLPARANPPPHLHFNPPAPIISLPTPDMSPPSSASSASVARSPNFPLSPAISQPTISTCPSVDSPCLEIPPLKSTNVANWTKSVDSGRKSRIREIANVLISREGTIWAGDIHRSSEFAQQHEWCALTLSETLDAYLHKTRGYWQSPSSPTQPPKIFGPATLPASPPPSSPVGDVSIFSVVKTERLSPPPVDPSSQFTPTAPVCPFGGATFLQGILPIWAEINAKVVPKTVTLCDLSTFRSKLEQGIYADPWKFIDDICTAVDNAKSGCNEGTQAHQYWIEVAQMLERKFNQVMRDIGYCCGNFYKFGLKPYTCAGKGCVIRVGDNYFCYEDSVPYCIKCFENAPRMVDVDDMEVDEDIAISSVQKSKFDKWKNNIHEPEPFVSCVTCGRKQHLVCVRYMEQLSPNGFKCQQCLPPGITLSLPSRARDLPKTRLSFWIEAHVNRYLTQEGLPLNIQVRVVASGKKVVHVKPELLQTSVEMSAALPYTLKSIFVFMEMADNTDVCCFAFQVHEFGPNCPAPNTGRVYISYVDSVHYYQPKSHRSIVYKEILLGYLGYAKQLGYSCAHLWVCPPPPWCSDYIFHAHPPEQLMPKKFRLQTWYKLLAKRGKKDGIVSAIKDIAEYAKETRMNGVSQIPYFEDDFWPEALEKLIRENRERKVAKKSLKENKKKPQKGPSGGAGDTLWRRVKEEIRKHKNLFYIILLNPENNLVGDPDGLIPCDLMEDRDNFMAFCRRQQCEFSTLRRAKYSTMAMVQETFNRLTATCINCCKKVTTRFHCPICNDFNLCARCNANRNGHEHLLKKVVIGEETVFPFPSDEAVGTENYFQGIVGSMRNAEDTRRCFRQ